MVSIVRVALVLMFAAACGAVWVHTQESTARVTPDLVVLNVTVSDPAGRFVPDLSAADFQVWEDEQPQQLTVFTPGTAPLSLMLLVDSSSSMDEEMSDVQQTLEEFVHQLRPQDSAELIDFDVRPKVLQPPTRDRNLLAAAVKRLRGGGSTSLYNALYITLRQLPGFASAMPGELRRNAVVLLSDGDDTSSLVSHDTLLDVATRAQTTIYAIGLHAPERGEVVLGQLTSQTGGRYFPSRRASDLRRSYAQIGQELASQYLIGYVSTNHARSLSSRSAIGAKVDEEWREVVVRVGRPNLEVRTRPGYRMGATARSDRARKN